MRIVESIGSLVGAYLLGSLPIGMLIVKVVRGVTSDTGSVVGPGAQM